MVDETTGIEAETSIDRRTRLWRAVRDRIASLVEEAGGRNGLTASQMRAISRAAELSVLADQARQRALQSQESTTEVVRLENLAARALRGLSLAKPKPTEQPSANAYRAYAMKRGAA